MAVNGVDNVFIPFRPINVKPKISLDNKLTPKTASSESFDKIFQEALNKGLKFSGHAINRLQTRNIEFSSEDIEKLNNAVNKAKEKGVQESLILLGDTALIVSIKNNTVITALTGDSMKENVFTNIDSAIIAR
jgi:flagellar operon protein